MLREDRHSRRRFVGRTGGALLGASALAAFVSACGGAKGQAENSGGQTQTDVTHPKTKVSDVVFSNWPLYIDKSVIKDFDKQFNAKLHYTEDINDNNDFFGKVRQP